MMKYGSKFEPSLVKTMMSIPSSGNVALIVWNRVSHRRATCSDGCSRT